MRSRDAPVYPLVDVYRLGIVRRVSVVPIISRRSGSRKRRLRNVTRGQPGILFPPARRSLDGARNKTRASERPRTAVLSAAADCCAFNARAL